MSKFPLKARDADDLPKIASLPKRGLSAVWKAEGDSVIERAQGAHRMLSKTKTIELFLSHAAADKSLVEAFETLLAKSMGLTSSNIFCSSLEGQGVPKGGDFVEFIRARAATADGVIALITPAYLDSPFCMAELGAAWVLQTDRLPIVVPPNTFKVMEATLLGIVGVRIDDQIALAQAFEDLGTAMNLTLPKVGVRARAMREFQRSWEDLKDSLQKASRIDASVHSEMVRQRDAALEARNEAENELSEAEAKIAALRKAKDATAVAKIDDEFDNSSWQAQLDDALTEVRDLYVDLGGKEIVRLLILDHIGKYSRPDFNSFPDETNRAVELDVYDEENERWNHNLPDVKLLTKIIEKVTEIFEENPEAAKHYTSKKQTGDPSKIKFWEEQL